MLPALPVARKNMEDERLEGDRTRAVVSNLFRGTQYPVSYTRVVWHCEHRVDTLFCQ